MPRTLTIPIAAPVAAAMLPAALLLAAPQHAAGAQGRAGVTAVDTTLALGRGGVVDLSLVSGEIRVVGWSRGDVHVRASTEGGELRFESSPTRITLEQELRGRRHDDTDARFEVSVPVGTRVLMRGTSGDLSVRGVKGDVEARTVSGGVDVEDTGDHAVLESVSGDVRATRLGGDVRARSVSGEVQIDDIAGDADCESVSGDVTIRRARSKVARAETVSGGVSYDGTIDPAGRYDFHAHSGDVELLLPPTTNASVSIETFSGEIESDFPLTLRPDTEAGRPRHARRLDFSLGNGGPRINLETFSGDVVIRSTAGRAKDARGAVRRPDRDKSKNKDRDQDDDDDDEPRD